MFDLDTAIAAWRRTYEYRRPFLREDVEELECHLRDHIDRLVAGGMTVEAAYYAAIGRIGTHEPIEQEYRKVYRDKLRYRLGPGRALWGDVTMIGNYIKVAWRALWKQKGYAAINVSGLALGIACCILIALFVRDEWSYDRFHTNIDRLYRAWVFEDYGEEQQFFNTVTPFPLAAALEASIPEVEATTRVGAFNAQVRHGETTLNERVHVVDPAFFDLFDFPLVTGRPGDVFAELNSIVLSESAARRFFGDDDPVGRLLSVDDGAQTLDLLVTGVARDVPSNSSIRFDLLISFGHQATLYNERALQSWFNVHPETYVLLQPGTDPDGLAPKLDALVRQVLGDQYEPGTYTVGLQPMAEIHLDPSFPVGMEPISDPQYSYILSVVALLVLFIACINFMTLAIGRSARRAREVAVRKVVGAQRRQLLIQFWGESVMMSVLGLGLGLVLAGALMPLFNELTGFRLTLTPSPFLLLFLAALTLVVGLVAGSYPALVLSAFKPVTVLKGALSPGRGSSLFRRGLVVLQFSLSIVLIISTLTMVRQLRYLQTKSLGFDKEQVVVLRTGAGRDEGLPLTQRLREALQGAPAVVGVASSAFEFGGGWLQLGYRADDGTYREFMANFVDHDYVRILGMEMAAGRDFDRAVTADENRSILVNEAFVRAYGWDNPIGQRLPGEFADHEVIGVVRDFNYESLHAPVQPLVLTLNPQILFEGASDVNFGSDPALDIAVRLAADDLPAALADLEAAWQRVAGDVPFEFAFLDETVDAQYRLEQRLGRLVGAAAVLAILIACMGLFGLAALTAASRTKEIGVRKVLGASAGRIVLMLSKDFAALVGVAFVVAAPVAYLVMNRWLADFAYRVQVGVGTLVLAAVLALAVAFLTVGYQALRAASVNPVDSLRYE